MFHRTQEGQTILGGLVGALVGRVLPVKRRNRGMATLVGAGLGAFVLRDQVIGILDQVGLFRVLDQVFGGGGGNGGTNLPPSNPGGVGSGPPGGVQPL